MVKWILYFFILFNSAERPLLQHRGGQENFENGDTTNIEINSSFNLKDYFLGYPLFTMNLNLVRHDTTLLFSSFGCTRIYHTKDHDKEYFKVCVWGQYYLDDGFCLCVNTKESCPPDTSQAHFVFLYSLDKVGEVRCRVDNFRVHDSWVDTSKLMKNIEIIKKQKILGRHVINVDSVIDYFIKNYYFSVLYLVNNRMYEELFLIERGIERRLAYNEEYDAIGLEHEKKYMDYTQSIVKYILPLCGHSFQPSEMHLLLSELKFFYDSIRI